jgi:flagellar biosynthesis/type III secretory pathway M-ring protein FliF/YscJ
MIEGKGEAVFTNIDEVLTEKIINRTEKNNTVNDQSGTFNKGRTHSEKQLHSTGNFFQTVVLVIIALLLFIIMFRTFRSKV